MGLNNKVISGERIRIPAADWNAILNAARKARDDSRFGSEASSINRQTTVCKIKNVTGGTLERFSVVGLGEPIILPDDAEQEFKRQLTFEGELPAAGTHEGKFAILLQPLADDAIGDAVIGGVVHCKLAVDVLDDVFGWAEIADGETATLNNVEVGSARVLWAEESGTERWALVRLAENTPAAIHEHVRVTGDSPLFGRYPAVIQDYDPQADTWSDRDGGDCYAIDPGGSALVEGIYLARRWDQYNDLPVFTPTEQLPHRLRFLRVTLSAGTYNDYNPTGLDEADVLVINATGAVEITGIAGGYEGRQLHVIADSGSSLTFTNNSGSSASENRFSLSTPVEMITDNVLALIYDGDNRAWGGGLLHKNLTPVDSDTVDVTFDSETLIISWDVLTHMSITSSAGGGLKLVNDDASPPAGYWYGTPHGSTTKGWQPLRVVSSMTELTDPGADRIAFWDDSATAMMFLEPVMSVIIDGTTLKLSGDSASPGNNKLYGTNGSGTKGWYDQPSGGGADYEPLTNGDADDPELIFADGDVVMCEVEYP